LSLSLFSKFAITKSGLITLEYIIDLIFKISKEILIQEPGSADRAASHHFRHFCLSQRSRIELKTV